MTWHGLLSKWILPDSPIVLTTSDHEEYRLLFAEGTDMSRLPLNSSWMFRVEGEQVSQGDNPAIKVSFINPVVS